LLQCTKTTVDNNHIFSCTTRSGHNSAGVIFAKPV